ncbi:LOW QUALITY PROTEIN: transmembrane protease serine 9-like [Gopherus evgoodei]|uniref:LOW QUALITY PROTEIN: transmembrane protease serine 9-like n=1 Tax=Gopherus evgoodei TaxID=1825980 RepID=UPI0011CF1412|nr:LOW QUALITY PROTEIN: transmembrane protease serine 9-like [Gopherus evgoodei]
MGISDAPAEAMQNSTPITAYRMNLGEYQLSNPPPPTRIPSPMRRIVRHSDYNPSILVLNVALVQLTEPINFTGTIRPISLTGSSTQFPAGEKCWVTGWGHIGWGCGDVLLPPRTLQQLQVSLFDVSTCEKLIGRCKRWNQPTRLCARAQDARSGPCKGDSGGPLVCPEGNSFILAGIVSWGINCTAFPPPHPGVYSRVSVYAEWIQEVTGSAGPSAFSPAVLSAGTTPLGSLSNGLVCSCLALALIAPLLAGLLLPAL